MRKVVEIVTRDKQKTEQVLNDRAAVSQHQCYKAAVSHYKHNCFNWNKPEVELHRGILLSSTFRTGLGLV